MKCRSQIEEDEKAARISHPCIFISYVIIWVQNTFKHILNDNTFQPIWFVPLNKCFEDIFHILTCDFILLRASCFPVDWSSDIYNGIEQCNRIHLTKMLLWHELYGTFHWTREACFNIVWMLFHGRNGSKKHNSWVSA